MRERICWADALAISALSGRLNSLYWLPAWGSTSPGGVLGAADAIAEDRIATCGARAQFRFGPPFARKGWAERGSSAQVHGASGRRWRY